MSLWPIRVYIISTFSSCWFLFGQNYSAFRTLTCRPYTLLYLKLCLPDSNSIYFFQTIYKWTMSQIKLVRTDSQLSQMSRASESMCADDILGTIYLCIYMEPIQNISPQNLSPQNISFQNLSSQNLSNCKTYQTIKLIKTKLINYKTYPTTERIKLQNLSIKFMNLNFQIMEMYQQFFKNSRILRENSVNSVSQSLSG